jgi:hypothetical protein
VKLWSPIIQAVDEKHVQIAGINPYLAVCLFELPEVLAKRDHPSAHDRIFPPLIQADPQANTEWRELVGPDLRHLFVSAGETIIRDLTGMRDDPLRENHLQVMFPAEHLPAWMTAINEARLILGAVYQVTEEDMELHEPSPDDPKALAILKIGILGELMGFLVEFVSGNAATPKPKARPASQPKPKSKPKTEPKSKPKPQPKKKKDDEAS